jgi:hypothetical protein
MERILSAPRWALVAVVATFTLAVAMLVNGLSGSANAASPPAAANWAPPAHVTTTTTTAPPTTVTTTVTEATTTTKTTTATLTALPVTGSSPGSSGGVAALVGAGLLMAGGIGMFGLRRLRDRRG